MKLKKMLTNKRNLLIIVVAFVTIITLTGCGKKDENQTKTYNKEADVAMQNVVNNTTNANEVTVSNNTISEPENTTNVTTDLLKDKSKKIVYAYVDDAKTWTETSVNGDFEVGYSYKIPQININSEDAEKINKAIQDEYKKIYDEQIASYKEFGNVGGCSRIEYAYHINGDILSVVMASFWDGGSVRRSSYNINTKTGKEVTNSELLKQKGIAEVDFNNKLSNILTNELKDMYTPNEEQLAYTGPVEFYNTQYKRTMDIENCSVSNKSNKMYLNANNQLCVIVTRYNIAGPDSTEIIVNMDTNSLYAQD